MRHKLPPGPGRPKGIPNKITASAREAFQIAFDGMGGAKALLSWGKDNPDKFYPIYAKLIPVEVAHTGSIKLNHAGFDGLFADVFGAGQATDVGLSSPVDSGSK